MKLMPTQDVTLLKTKITRGFSILIFRELLIKIFSFIGQLLVARILAPSDFGYFVIISFIVGFFGLFSDIGLTWAIIQKKEEPTKEEISIIFTFKLLLNILLIGIIFSLSPFITTVYPNFGSVQIAMLQLFSLTLLFTCIRSVPVSLLEREIHYDVISAIDVAGVLMYQISVLIFAYLGFGVWSLINAVLFKELVEATIALLCKPLDIKIKRIGMSSIKKMIHFGVFIQGNGIINFLHTSIIPVVIGVRNGPYQVGVLNWASSIAAIPMTVTDNFGRVAFSGFSKFQTDIVFLSKAIQKSIGVLSIITLFFTVLILGFSKEAVALLYTNKWIVGVPALYWFCANTFFIAAMSAIGSGILVIGKSRDIFFVTIITTISEWLLALSLVSLLGYIGVAVTSTIISFLSFLLYLTIAKKRGLVPDITKTLFPKILVLLITLLLIVMMNKIIGASLIYLFIKLVTASMCYFLLMFCVARDDLLSILKIITTNEKIYLMYSKLLFKKSS